MHPRSLLQALGSAFLLLASATTQALDCNAGFDAAVTGDYAAALKPMTKCAEQGGVNEQFYLGVMYEQGLGVTQDYALAAHWYRKAAAQGNDQAARNLGGLYARGQGVPQDLMSAYLWWDIAAGAGDADAGAKRDHAAATMTTTQRAEAKARSEKCVRSRFRECG